MTTEAVPPCTPVLVGVGVATRREEDPSRALEPIDLMLEAVRAAVQRDIEPRPQGGVLTVSAAAIDGGAAVTVVGGAGEPVVLVLAAATQPG